MGEWDLNKKKSFVKAMGKRRPRFARGGRVPHYAEGSQVRAMDENLLLGSPTTSGVAQNATNPNSGLMGTINGALGLNNNFQASAAEITPGTNVAQLNKAYQDTQAALNNQNQLVTTLQPQAGTAVGNQNELANQYLAMTKGEGPNPARAQLEEATARNVANQAAMAAGQRGAGANAGLIARQAAQTGAQTQQAAAGQAATLEAQQQIAAQKNLENLSANQISQTGQAITGQNSAQQNEQATLQNANTSANNARVGMQSNINNVNSQTAAANQNMAANTLGGIMSAASSAAGAFGMAEGGEVKEPHHKLAEMNAHALKKYEEGGEVESDLGNFKANEASASSPDVPATASLPADQTDFSKAMSGGDKKGGDKKGGGLMALAAMADGGQIQQNPLLSPQSSPAPAPASFAQTYFTPGQASSGPQIEATATLPKNTEKFSDDIKKSDKKTPEKSKIGSQSQTGPGMHAKPSSEFARGGDVCHGPHKCHVANYLFAKGGEVQAMVSPGEVYLDPEKVRRVIENGEDPAKIGVKFKGKAKIKGDSLKNDIIPATLQEGGVVVDRENMGSREKRELFVHRAIARKKARR